MIILDLLVTFQIWKYSKLGSLLKLLLCPFIGKGGFGKLEATFLEEIEGYSIDFQYRDDPFWP